MNAITAAAAAAATAIISSTYGSFPVHEDKSGVHGGGKNFNAIYVQIIT